MEDVGNGEGAEWRMSAMARAQIGGCRQWRRRKMEDVGNGEDAKLRVWAMAHPRRRGI